jgi:hypothetical protein
MTTENAPVPWIIGAAVAAFVLYSCSNTAENRGEAAGQNQVYEAEGARRSKARTELCDDLERIPLDEVEADPGLVSEPVGDVLSYDPDGRNVIGFQDSYVIEAVAQGCPNYLEPVIAAVDEWIEYQGRP